MTRLARRLAAFLISRHSMAQAWEEATERAVKAEQERDVLHDLCTQRGAELLRARESVEHLARKCDDLAASFQAAKVYARTLEQDVERLVLSQAWIEAHLALTEEEAS